MQFGANFVCGLRRDCGFLTANYAVQECLPTMPERESYRSDRMFEFPCRGCQGHIPSNK